MAGARRKVPLYTISVAARLSELPVYTIRWLESHRFVRPSRTGGNQRLFSEEDVALLREIADLLERRVNIAGIRVIFQIKRTYRITSLRIKED